MTKDQADAVEQSGVDRASAEDVVDVCTATVELPGEVLGIEPFWLGQKYLFYALADVQHFGILAMLMRFMRQS